MSPGRKATPSPAAILTLRPLSLLDSAAHAEPANQGQRLLTPTTGARRRRVAALTAGACCAATLLIGCSRPGGDNVEAASTDAGSASAAPADFEGSLERLNRAKVLTSPVEMREMVRALSTTVNAVSEKEIEIFPRASGVVVEVLVEEGDRVSADDVLMRLDPRELQAALDEARIAKREAEDAKVGLEFAVVEANAQVARAELTFIQSEKELERKESAGEGIISRNELENQRLTVQTNDADLAAQRVAKQRAEAALKSQEIAIERAALQVATATLNLSFVDVTAPFDGVIASRTIRVGDLTSNAAAAFVLTDPDNVRAVVSRPQRELGFFHRAEQRARPASDAGAAADSDALTIEIQPEALPGESYAGHILFVSPTIDSASGQFRVTLGVEQPDPDALRPPVLPGMLLRVRIVTERHPNALSVPKRALLREGDSDFVFIADRDIERKTEGTARKVRVQEGFSTDDDVEVVAMESGALNPGDPVIVVGNRDLQDGDAIEMAPWTGRKGAPTPEPDAELEDAPDGAAGAQAELSGEASGEASDDSAAAGNGASTDGK